MNIIHFADLHIGVENYGRIDPQTGLSTRLQDFLAAFDELVEYALSWPADVVIFAGDAYKSRDPSQTQQREFAARIQRLVANGIPVYLLTGNHDMPNAWGRATALDIFETLAVPNITVCARSSATVVETRAGPLQVVGMPWPNRTALLTRDELRELTLAELDRELERRVSDRIRWLAEQLNPELPALLTAHIAMHDARIKSGSESAMTTGAFAKLLPTDLAGQYFDYVALGHHHIYQQVRDDPPMFYAGSMQRVDFGEEDDPKGFIAVTLDPAKPRGMRIRNADFREVAARRFVTIRVAIRNDDDPTADVLRAIERRNVRDAIVRVQLHLTSQQNAKLRLEAIQEALQPAAYLAGITREIEREVRRRINVPGVSSLEPLDALRYWLEYTDVAEDRRDELLRYARSVIEEADYGPADAAEPGAPTVDRMDDAAGQGDNAGSDMAQG